MPSFCRGDCGPRSLLERPTCEKLRECLAEAIKLLALLPTPLLLRFFSESALCLPGGLPLPLRFSPLTTWSVGFVEPVEVGLASTLGSGDGGLLPDFESELSAESDLLPPNILFNSRPPCEVRLRRLLPARFSMLKKDLEVDGSCLRSESYVQDSCGRISEKELPGCNVVRRTAYMKLLDVGVLWISTK